jgi:hypothetical protein
MRLPKSFQTHFRKREFASGDCVLVIFGGQHPILSKQVQDAVERLSGLSEPNRVAVSHNFTREGFEILTAQGFRTYCERDYLWTDESLKSVL